MTKLRIYLSSPHMGGEELKLVQDAFATNWIAPLGPHVDGFEREFATYVGGRTVVACSQPGIGPSAVPLFTAVNPASVLDSRYAKSTRKIEAERADGGGRTAEARGQTSDVGHLTSDIGRQSSGGEGRIPDFRGQTSDVGHLTSGALHAAALSSGTAALHLALRGLNLQLGDEVICSSLTFSASANPILYERATPVFVDSDETSWNMDPALLAEAITEGIKRGKKPKAVILVHLYGQSADLDPIAATCAEHGIPLIEDAAEALGAIYYRAGTTDDRRQTTDLSPPSAPRRGVAPGTVGLCGVFSFNGNKIITTSGGGMLVSGNQALIDKARFWATQARDPAPHYQHSEVGFNYRMSNVLAAIGRGQLRVLEQRVDARRRNCAFYQEALKDLPGVAFMPEADFGRCTRWLTAITINPQAAGVDREKVRLALEAENIEARPVWKPMHQQPIFKDSRCYGGAVSERLFEEGLCLPSGSNLSETDLQRVVEAFRKQFKT